MKKLLLLSILMILLLPQYGNAELNLQVSPEKSSYDFVSIEGIPYYSLKEVIKLNVIVTNIDPMKFDKDSLSVRSSIDNYQQPLSCNFRTESVASIAYECYLTPFELTTLSDTYSFNLRIHFNYDSRDYNEEKPITISVNALPPEHLNLQLTSYEIEGEDLEAKAYHKSCTDIKDMGDPLVIKLYFNSNFLNPKYMKITAFTLDLNGVSIDLMPLSFCTFNVNEENLIEAECQINNFEVNNVITCSTDNLSENDQVSISADLNVKATMGDNDPVEFSFTFSLPVLITSLITPEEIQSYVQQNANYEVLLDKESYTFRNIEGTDYYELAEEAIVKFRVLGIDTDYITSVKMRTSLDNFNGEVECEQSSDYYLCLLPVISGHYGSSLPQQLNIDVLFTYVYDDQEFNTQHTLNLKIDKVVYEPFTLSSVSYELIGEDLEGSVYNADEGTYCIEMYDGGSESFYLTLYPEINYIEIGERDLAFKNFRLTVSFPSGSSRTFYLTGVECRKVDDERIRYDCVFPNIHVLSGMFCSNIPVIQGGVLHYQGTLTFDVYYLGRLYVSDLSLDPYDSTFIATTLLQDLSSAFTTNVEIIDSQIKCSSVVGSTYCSVSEPSGHITVDVIGIPTDADFSLSQGSFLTEDGKEYKMSCEITEHQDLSARFECYFEPGSVIKLKGQGITGTFIFTTTLNNDVSYHVSKESVFFSADIASYEDISYEIVDTKISIVPSDEEGRVSCAIDEDYKCDLSAFNLTLDGILKSNAPDLATNKLEGYEGIKLIIDTGEKTYELRPKCEVNEENEVHCTASLNNVEKFTYVSAIGVFAYYASGDHVDEEFASQTLTLVIPNELLSTYSSISFNGEIVVLSKDAYKTSQETLTDLPVCIIPVNVGKYYEDYNANRVSTTISTQQIWDVLKQDYGYGNVNYDQPLCSFSASSIGVIISVPEMYHTDDFELHSIYYSLGNARDFYSATCVPLNSEYQGIDSFKYGKRGMKFYCMLPNLDFLMDDFTGAIPYTTQEMEIPLYVKIMIRDGPWDREGTKEIPFKFIMENSYGTLTEKLNSLKEQKDELEKQRDKINGIASRSSKAAMSVAGMDAAFGANAFGKGGIKGKLEFLSIPKHTGCPIGCMVVKPHKRATCHSKAKSYGGLGKADGLCFGFLDYSYVCTLGGALLMSKSMKTQLENIEQKHEEVTNEIYDVEDRLMSGDSYSSIYSDLKREYDAQQEGYHRSFIMELPQAISGLGGGVYSAVCALMGFKGFSSATKEITTQTLTSQIATNLITTGINSWVYEGKINVGEIAVGTATSTLVNQLTSKYMSGHDTLRWLAWGPTLFGLYQAIEEKPEGISTFDSVLYWWGSWSFSTGISAASMALVEMGRKFYYQNILGGKVQSEINTNINKIIEKDEKGNIDYEKTALKLQNYLKSRYPDCEVEVKHVSDNKYYVTLSKDSKDIFTGRFSLEEDKFDYNFGTGYHEEEAVSLISKRD